MPFAPLGNRARWRMVYDLLKKKNIGDVLSYTEIGLALELNPVEDRHAIQMAARRAAKEYEEEDQRAVEVEVGVGYRVVQPEHHLVLARQHNRKAGRAIKRGLSKVTNVDLSGMDPQMRGAFDVMARAFMQQVDINRRVNRRVTDVEALVTETRERTAEQYQELAARLERLEGKAQNTPEGSLA